MSLSHAANPGRHSFVDRQSDLYETPDVAVEALLRVEKLPRRLWEPACGPGRIVRVLERAGHNVLASDVVDYGQPVVQDFFACSPGFGGDRAIVTNPPYQLANEFVLHALRHSPLVVMLLRLAFYESDRRTPILENCGLARIHCFRKRLPMMHRDGWKGRKANSGMAFAWFVWDRSHSGPTEIHRISWERP